jgi:hypothetical protein
MSLLTSLTGYWDMIGNSNDGLGTNNGTDNTVSYNKTFGGDTNVANYTGSSPSRTTTGAVFASGANAKSFSLWFDSDSATDRGWLIAGGTDLDGQAFGLFIQDDDLYFHGNGGAHDLTILTDTVTQGTWMHIVVTYDGTTLRTYVNGSAGASAARSLNTASGQAIWFAGRKNGDSNGWFDGGLSRIGVWSKELTSAEVTRLYNSGSGLKYSELAPKRSGILAFF